MQTVSVRFLSPSFTRRLFRQNFSHNQSLKISRSAYFIYFKNVDWQILRLQNCKKFGRAVEVSCQPAVFDTAKVVDSPFLTSFLTFFRGCIGTRKKRGRERKRRKKKHGIIFSRSEFHLVERLLNYFSENKTQLPDRSFCNLRALKSVEQHNLGSLKRRSTSFKDFK